jgi:thiol-disulfide isomerase/thioredoxin
MFSGLEGGMLHLEDYRGQVVLLNVWASWCAPCRREMPAFERVYQEYKDDGFVILGVAQDHVRDLPRVRSFVASTGVTYPIGYDPASDFAAFSGKPVRAIPTSFLIDQQGRVRMTKVGLLRDNVLKKALTPLLAGGSGG